MRILKIYGISQNPDTKEFIMVFDYAEGGDLNHWMNKNYSDFDWLRKLLLLWNIINGLREIHQKRMVHRDFHTGNILLINDDVKDYMDDNIVHISDMELCGDVSNIDQNNNYGVIPYVAPEVLKEEPYTQAADVYSFGMIMYFVGTGKQPFSDCAHDQYLAISICNGNRPEVNEPEIPKCYSKLMKECWDSTPDDRPDAEKIFESINLFYSSYKDDESDFKRYMKIEKEQQHYEIEKQFKEAEEYRISNLSSFDKSINTHTQAIYKSRLLNPFTKSLIIDFTKINKED
ncbi:kinase-like domain-containing protein [Rhizophagus irregularis DAOM 181602=DAOM 197198]|uniref:Kinase-like domain-containing protein n=2 Tax=Rhizophagus irregularis TaxID=588596 RepID=A0A2H5R1A6_RHIID|nr:kinase-like domain-containing protein [Rhizophagus irregularis DAOM 181602=DAOM 197198]POG72342.1 kinase-like domain-containing protein [Rhizophagus irregularis DAOM 181602=DAOM 197198]|eukprot:XP_025179208.1 kinase-like domain-containing protein [Rhizophagus irregularis DAOM 181602=DAOM 197198]